MNNSMKKVIGCKEHIDAYLINDQLTGDLICSDCGYVVEEQNICDEAEWRNFIDDTTTQKWMKSRVGDAENPFFSDNLGTSIRVDKNKNKFSSFGAAVVKQFKRRSVNSALLKAYSCITEMCAKIHLPDSVVRRAKYVYYNVYRKLGLKGNIVFIDSKVAASVFIACRLEKCSRSVRQIAAISEVPQQDIISAAQRLLKILKEKIPICDNVVSAKNSVSITANVRDKIKNHRICAEPIPGVSICIAEKKIDPGNLKKLLPDQTSKSVGMTEDAIQKTIELLRSFD